MEDEEFFRREEDHVTIKFVVSILALMVITAGMSIGVYHILQDNKSLVVIANANVTTGQAPLNISFTCDGSDPDGKLERFLWDFGDGATSDQRNINHTYFWRGKFYARLTVWDDKGKTARDTIEINVFDYHTPIASASANTTSGKLPLTISFKGSGYDSDGTIDSYYWEFGDGTTSTEQNPTHVYEKTGTFYAHLTVTDNDGEINVDSLEINVIENYPPVAHASADVTSGRAPLSVQFRGEGEDHDGSIKSYQWIFEDAIIPKNRVSTEQEINHVYWLPGVYLATFTVSDNDGATDTVVIQIEVEESLFTWTLQLVSKLLIKKILSRV
jgi:PKD repeat protein